MGRRRHLLLAAGVWTLLVWGTRIDNIRTDDALDAAGRLGRILLALSFLAVAAALVWVWHEVRDRVPGTAELTAVAVAAAWTTAVWLVRGAGIATGGHGAAFVVVHLVLAVGSIGLVATAARQVITAHRNAATA